MGMNRTELRGSAVARTQRRPMAQDSCFNAIVDRVMSNVRREFMY